MATVAIGDIHGNVAALDDLLSTLLPELHPTDTLVFLGDYIDDGPDARRCIDRILDVRETGPCPVVGLLGNHEQWMLKSLSDSTKHSWLLGMAGLTTVASYSTEVAAALREELGEAGPRLFVEKPALSYDRFFEAMPDAHLEFFTQLLPSYRSSEVVCVHGGYDPLGGDDQDFVWGADSFPDAYTGSERVVYGHHNDAVLDDRDWPHPNVTRHLTFGIDSVRHGVLTAIRFPDLAVFQSGQHLT